MLLQLMVDAASSGWRDANGMLSKATVETKILPKINEKLSQLKYFKREYQKYSQLLRHSSGFGWDPTTKKFTTPKEVWKDYFKDLQIVIGNATTIGRNSLGLGDDTDARISRAEDRHVGIEDFVFDDENLEGNAISNETTQQAMRRISHSIDSIATDFRGVHNLLAKKVKKREQQSYMWDAIKETLNLDERACYKALSLLNTNTKKDAFLKMSYEERSNWISYNLE
ncbi:hypothetical protein PRUPE_1G130600 [Prunus persica]|uniref:Uncharacterized protein n=1 Tax=Prunus persica TaxID=3760 RepID=M5XI99_PRUPE|nr:hypothetical protein PRUPE_1G130600 [Prunus persica]